MISFLRGLWRAISRCIAAGALINLREHRNFRHGCANFALLHAPKTRISLVPFDLERILVIETLIALDSEKGKFLVLATYLLVLDGLLE